MESTLIQFQSFAATIAVLAACWAMNFKFLVPVLLALAVPLAVKRAHIPQHLLGHVALHQGTPRKGWEEFF
eukprot:Skav207588  [mRNA]  locus=scaffold2450:46961:47173:+ [translate_table: standard]